MKHVILTLFASLLLGSCAGPKPVEYPKWLHVKLNDRAVAISAACEDDEGMSVSGGSGIIMSNTLILTAAHVIDGCDSPRVKIKLADGKVYHVDIVSANFDDTAYLRLSDGFSFALDYAPMKIAFPVKGETVCLAPAVPEREMSCGAAIETEKRFPPGNFQHSARTIPGNSGGGIYNLKGELVAVVTHTTFDKGGLGTTLMHHRRLVLSLY